DDGRHAAVPGPHYPPPPEGPISLSPPADYLSNSPLNRRAEEAAVGGIDPPIHEAVGVGWRDDGVVRDGQQVAARHSDLGKWAKSLTKGGGDCRIGIHEVQSQRSASATER